MPSGDGMTERAGIGWGAQRAAACTGVLLLGLVAGLASAAVAAPIAATPAAGFDLAAYRQLAASDRARGIREGRQALSAGVLDGTPRERMRLLWYMGGAAIGMPDELALGEVIGHLEQMEAAGHAGAGSLAGFLRGARKIDLGRSGEGLVEVLSAANAVGDDDELRRIAAAELCRAYANLGEPARGLPHCRRHTLLVEAGEDAAAQARAYYLEASVLSTAGDPAAAIPRWRQARQLFAELGRATLAGRTSGSLAVDLNGTGDHAGALAMATEAVDAAQAAGNTISIAIALNQVASAQLGLGELDGAEATLARAAVTLEGIDHPPTQRELRLTQRELLAARGTDPARLAELDAQIARLDDAAPAEEHAGVIDQLEQQYLQREQALRIGELEQENRRKELEIEAARQQAQQQRMSTWLWVVSTLALACLLAALAWGMRAQRRLAQGLRDQAYRDGLTRLPNRRALLERMQQLIDSEPAGPHALVMADIDHFKQVNDSHGHLVGDRVLSAVADALAAQGPADGLVARLGGEEFVVLVPRAGLGAAVHLSERLRAAIAGLEIEIPGARPLRVTASFGVAPFPGPGAADQAGWLGTADAALYQAKRAGRDRVVVAGAG